MTAFAEPQTAPPTLRAEHFSVQGGLVLIEYDETNPAARGEAQRAALRLAVDRSVITVPVPGAEVQP